MQLPVRQDNIGQYSNLPKQCLVIRIVNDNHHIIQLLDRGSSAH